MTKSDSTVRVVHDFHWPAEAVFDAWLDPNVLRQWMFNPVLRNESVIEIKMDPRPGGNFYICIIRDEKQLEFQGKYLRIDRPSHLIFTWVSVAGGETLVSIEIKQLESGCRLTLVHELGDVTEDIVAIAKANWEAELNLLDKTLPS